MTDASSNPSSPKTVFAEFPTLRAGRDFMDRVKVEMAIGPYSINAPTASGGSRVAVQVDSSSVSKVNELIKEFEGTATTPKPTARKKKEDKEEAPATNATQEKEGGTEVPVATKSKKPASKKQTVKKERIAAAADYKQRPHCSCGVYVADKKRHLEKMAERKDKREHKFA